MTAASSNIPRWKVSGDWFDVCKCNIPCPCTFAQTPTYVDCDLEVGTDYVLVQLGLVKVY